MAKSISIRILWLKTSLLNKLSIKNLPGAAAPNKPPDGFAPNAGAGAGLPKGAAAGAKIVKVTYRLLDDE